MSSESDRTAAADGRGSSVLHFFLLTFLLTVPFWMAAHWVPVQFLPGLPLRSLMVLCPVTSAIILRTRERGIQSVWGLLRRSLDVRGIPSKVWLVPTVLLSPAVFLLAGAAQVWMGQSVPTPSISAVTPLVLTTVFFVAALGEELGWMGVAFEPMQRRFGTLGAGILLGLVWAAWHFVPFLQGGRSLVWIGWQTLFLVSSRVLIVWIFNNTGRSIFAAALFHATANVSWALFPIHGSYYDPHIVGLVTAFAAIAVTVVWGSQSLTRREIRTRARVSADSLRS